MIWGKKVSAPAEPKSRKPGILDLDLENLRPNINAFDAAIGKTFQRSAPVVEGIAMDGEALQQVKAQLSGNYYNNISDVQLAWYSSQSFFGYQLCAMLAQNWFIDKSCTMPARDAIRKGFEISVPEGIEVDPAKITALKKMNKRMRLNHNMVEFIRMKNIFGIRIALFNVESTDLQYYEKPFNIDGVKKGAYKGITQVDPYWITPELDLSAAANPSAQDFYVPTWWRISGVRYHKSHLIIAKTSEVPDILKPTYFYGGIPVPQKIFERVYCAEMTANEAPKLAFTKRTTTLKTDLTQIAGNQDAILGQIANWAYFRDNYGVKLISQEDEVGQLDTSLADLDAVIMTQFQVACAIAEVPSTKMLGTAPKGFNATGEYEEASYHQSLESIQEHDLTPFVDRHLMLCIKSEISPDAPFEVEISWNPLDVPTEKEKAEVNLTKAQTGAQLAAIGAIDGITERERLALDPDSGYANLPDIDREIDIDEANGDDKENSDTE